MKTERSSFNRILAVLVMVCLVLCFSGCQSGSETEQPGQEREDVTASDSGKDTGNKDEAPGKDASSSDVKQQNGQDTPAVEGDTEPFDRETEKDSDKKPGKSSEPTRDEPTQDEQPTQGEPTQGEPTQGEPTQDEPTQGNPQQSDPKPQNPKPVEPKPQDPAQMTYEKYSAMSAEEQYEFFMSFEDHMDFVRWLDAAKAEYDAKQTVIVVNPGDVIDLGG